MTILSVAEGRPAGVAGTGTCMRGDRPDDERAGRASLLLARLACLALHRRGHQPGSAAAGLVSKTEAIARLPKREDRKVS